MAIQWKVDGELDSIQIHTGNDSDNTYNKIAIMRGNDGYSPNYEQYQTNAALICDAVNNTAGKGIDPVAVPGLLKALQECVKHITHNDPDIPAVLIEAKKAIKSAEIK